jgi:hypothetical protein
MLAGGADGAGGLCDSLYRGANPRSVIATPEEEGRKRGLLAAFVTRPEIGEESGALP